MILTTQLNTEHTLEDLSGRIHWLQCSARDIHLQPEKHGVSPEMIAKGGKDYTSAVDIAVEKFLVGELRNLVEGDVGFVGEETENARGSRYFWMIDPTDGTAIYSLGGEYYSNVIALLDRQEEKILISNVYQPRTQRSFRRVGDDVLVIESYQIRPLNQSDSRCYAEWLGCAFAPTWHYDARPGLKEQLERIFAKSKASNGRTYGPINARPASGSTALYCSDIADGNRHFAVVFGQAPWDLIGAASAEKLGRPAFLLTDDGEPRTDMTIEQAIARADKKTVLNAAVFANEYVRDEIMGRLSIG